MTVILQNHAKVNGCGTLCEVAIVLSAGQAEKRASGMDRDMTEWLRMHFL